MNQKRPSSKDQNNPYPPDPVRGTPWVCPQCSYRLNTNDKCINCGRDHWGTDPGDVIDPDTRPFRPGLRGGA